MKQILFAAITLISLTSLAQVPELKACSGRDQSIMETTIAEKQADGYTHIYLMVNKNNEPVGFYAHNPEYADGMYAEVCDYVDSDELTISSDFYYFEGKANPTLFKKGEKHYLTQDEGIAYLDVLEESAEGEIQGEFSLVGWDQESNEHVVRKSQIKFESYSK